MQAWQSGDVIQNKATQKPMFGTHVHLQQIACSVEGIFDDLNIVGKDPLEQKHEIRDEKKKEKAMPPCQLQRSIY